MGARLVAALGATAAAAFLAALAAHAAGPEGAPEKAVSVDEAQASPPARHAVASEPSGAKQPERAIRAPLAPKQPPVPPGVLVRAASRRAQEREAASTPTTSQRRRTRDAGNIVSVEIDWHAPPTDR